MRVSVVVPCHNSLRWLPATIDSVLAQTYQDFEVVLVDDGGDDDLASWASSLGDARIRTVRQENAGVSAARNRGIAEARGELIALLDSDDLWEPTALEALVAAHDAAVAATGPGDPGVGLTYGWYDVIDGAGMPTGRVATASLQGEVWDEFVCTNPIAVGAVLVPAAVFEQVGGFLENRDRFEIDVEDWDLWIRIAASHRVGLAPRVVLHVRRHDANSTGAGVTRSLEAAYDALFERAFDPEQVPRRRPEVLARLRARSRARANTVLAWHAMNLDDDPDAAARYLRIARSQGHGAWRNADLVRATAALMSRRTLGRAGFDAVRRSTRVLRRPVSKLRTRRA